MIYLKFHDTEENMHIVNVESFSFINNGDKTIVKGREEIYWTLIINDKYELASEFKTSEVDSIVDLLRICIDANNDYFIDENCFWNPDTKRLFIKKHEELQGKR